MAFDVPCRQPKNARECNVAIAVRTLEPVAAILPGAGATSALAVFVAETAFDDIPAAAIERLRDCFLDFVGNSAFASARAESSPPVRAAIQQLDNPDGPATAIGEARGYAWHYAALLNGAYAHTLDFDDTNFGHPGAPVIPAALAEAERLDVSGATFLTALAVGYEVFCRIGAALGAGGYERGFHGTAISGIFGAVAAVGKLRGLDAKTIENAFGLALSKASGSMQYLENGSWNKRVHPGFAAHDALLCVTMAEAGVIGAASAIEGRYGVLTSFTSTPQPEVLLADLGRTWMLLHTAIKPYPSCRFTHAAVDAALALRGRFAPNDRPRVAMRIALSPVAWKIVGERLPAKLAPRNAVDAQFSVYFQVAAAWLDGRVAWSSYLRIAAPELVAMTPRIAVTSDPTIKKLGARLEVDLDGETAALAVEQALGEPENPLRWDELVAKFISLAMPVYGDASAREITAAVHAVSGAPRMTDIIKRLRSAR
jgi:2-methylcitrate dehydratase PrpD